MIDEGHHEAAVDAWVERSTKDLPAVALLELFEATLGAIWNRAVTTLGEVTLTAIAERVFYNASEKLPLLSSLRVGPNGEIQFQELHEAASSVREGELLVGIRFVLVEFLTVLGNVTAEILTPELHAGLTQIESTNVGERQQGSAT